MTGVRPGDRARAPPPPRSERTWRAPRPSRTWATSGSATARSTRSGRAWSGRRLGPGEVVDVGHDAAERGRGGPSGLEAGQIGRDDAVDHRLELRFEHRGRRREVVGDVAGSAPPEHLGTLEPVGHRVEGLGQLGRIPGRRRRSPGRPIRRPRDGGPRRPHRAAAGSAGRRSTSRSTTMASTLTSPATASVTLNSGRKPRSPAWAGHVGLERRDRAVVAHDRRPRSGRDRRPAAGRTRRAWCRRARRPGSRRRARSRCGSRAPGRGPARPDVTAGRRGSPPRRRDAAAAGPSGRVSKLPLTTRLTTMPTSSRTPSTATPSSRPSRQASDRRRTGRAAGVSALPVTRRHPGRRRAGSRSAGSSRSATAAPRRRRAFAAGSPRGRR